MQLINIGQWLNNIVAPNVGPFYVINYNEVENHFLNN